MMYFNIFLIMLTKVRFAENVGHTQSKTEN